MSTVLDRPAPPSPAGPERTRGPVLGWRALLRLAARDARRRKGRTALVVLLLAVPVALLAIWTVVLRSANLDEDERNLLRLGDTADAVVSNAAITYTPDGRATPADAADEVLPAGWRSATVQDVGYGRVRLGDRFHRASIEAGDLTDPLLAGAVDLRTGRAPAAAGEAAVTTEVARRYGVGVGDTIVVRRGATALTVVGTYEWAIDVNRVAVLTATPVGASPDDPFGGTVWVDAPDGLAADDLRSALPAPYRSTAAIRGEFVGSYEGASPVVILYTMATIGLFVVGIVISAAFAVSARRQLRMLGVIGSNGGAPGQLRTLMTAQGIVTGLAGVAVAAVLAAIGLAAVAPHLNRLSGYRLPGLRLSPLDVVVTVVLAVATATLAAYLPARSAARVPTLAALAGRRPLRPVSVGVPVLGLVSFGLGLLVIALSVGAQAADTESWMRFSGAGFLLLLGAVLVMPWLMGRLEPLAGRLRGPSRLAARSMARHRSRTGPIAAAILAAAGGAMALATFDAAYYPFDDTNGLGPDVVQIGAYDEDRVNDASVSDAVVGRVTAIVGPSAVARWSFVTTDDRGVDAVRIDGRQASVLTTDLATVRASGLPAEAVAAFDAGRVLLYDAAGAADDERLIEQVEVDPRTGQERAATPLTIDTEPVPYVAPLRVVLGEPCTAANGCDPSFSAPALIVPADRLDDLGWEAQTGFVQVAAARGAIGADERRELRRLHADLQDEADEAEASGGDVVRTYLNFDGQYVPGFDWVPFILGGIVLLAVVGVTMVGLALSAAEGRADDDTLVALGAPPRLRRRVRAYEALGTAGIACVLAVPLGFVPAAIAIRAERQQFDSLRRIGIPWTMIAIIAIGVPVLGALVAYATGRNHRTLLVRED